MIKILLFIALITNGDSVGIRKSSDNLSQQEKTEFLNALYLMKSTPSIYDPTYNAYDFFVYVHIINLNLDGTGSSESDSYAHTKWSFLPWHRIFLYLFELEMQRVTNNTNLYIPYWNPTNLTESNILLYDTSFLGGDGNPYFPFLIPDTHPTLSCDKFPINWNLNGFPWIYNYSCLHRQIGVGVDINDWNHNGTSTFYQTLLPKKLWNDIIINYRPYDQYPYWSKSENFTVKQHYNSFRAILEGCIKWNDIDNSTNADLVWWTSIGACMGLHGSLHTIVGGQLPSSASPNDPLFFMLHGWIDLMWSRYQKKYQGIYDDASIPDEFLDIDITNDNFNGMTDYVTTRKVLDHENDLGYIYDFDYDNDSDVVYYSTTFNITTTVFVDEESNANIINIYFVFCVYLVYSFCAFCV